MNPRLITSLWSSVVAATILAMAGVLFLMARRNHGSPPRPTEPAPTVARFKANIPYAEAAPILDRLRAYLPSELNGKTALEIEHAWPAWVVRHDTDIRARLARGDEDSVVNFWLYGTTFTALPRATQHDLAALDGRLSAEQLLLGRLDDLVAGMRSPGLNERVQFARHVVELQGIDLATTSGQEQARRYLIEARERVVAETDRYRRSAEAAIRLNDVAARLTAYSTVYRDRGLSSDTSITADFAIDKALDAIKSAGTLGEGDVLRVAIVGPGLDFTDKAQGYDFYPQQTVQPFAVIDSLIRLRLANSGNVRVTTLDLSPRVNQHLETARQRARAGAPYVLQLPLPPDDRSRQWNPEVVMYWRHVGETIGKEVEPLPAPPAAGPMRVRAVRVDPAVVLSIAPRDLNIVMERLEPAEPFDLIVATNILVYYDRFDQALALANISKMLRPGGFLVTNYAVSPTAPMDSSASLRTTVEFDRQRNGDTLFWYQRR